MIHENVRPESSTSETMSQMTGDQLFTVRPSLDSETLLANAAQHLASVQALMGHLAFEVDGAQRDIALAVHRMLEGIQLMVGRVLDLNEIPGLNTPIAS